MAYADHFRLADDIILHLDSAVHAVTDPFILSRYAGFTAVAAATVYELAVKDIFISFAKNKNMVFGTFTENLYERINGRISLHDLKTMHVKRFGEKYQKRFNKTLGKVESLALKTKKISVLQSYNNVITWRHTFAHEGQVPAYATYNDVRSSYHVGKDVINCLAKTMVR